MDSGSKDTAELKEKLKGKVSLTTKRNTESIEIEKWLSAAGKSRFPETLTAGTRISIYS